MARKKKSPRAMKELEVITDPEVVKVLFEQTRVRIVFKYLTKTPMTVTQLGSALDKNPGTILRHIDKLKKAGLVVEDHTDITRTGVVERYYRAAAREFRLGISNMLQSEDGVAEFAKAHFLSMIKYLSVYGVIIPESHHDEAVKILGELLERENRIISKMRIMDEDTYDKLPVPIRNDASRIIRRFAMERDEQYRLLREKWHTFLELYNKG